tara:strand:- start:261 stop:506 length:246 start_codon:yes stop_codon:yes gene_type:complete
MLEQIIEAYEDCGILKADGFDDAIIGIDSVNYRLIYSISKVIQILVDEGMTQEDAWDHFGFNIECAYVGEQTPIWCKDDFL